MALELWPNLQQLTHQLAWCNDAEDAKGGGEAVSSHTDMIRVYNRRCHTHLAYNFMIIDHINRKTKTENLQRLKKKKMSRFMILGENARCF